MHQSGTQQHKPNRWCTGQLHMSVHGSMCFEEHDWWWYVCLNLKLTEGVCVTMVCRSPNVHAQFLTFWQSSYFSHIHKTFSPLSHTQQQFGCCQWNPLKSEKSKVADMLVLSAYWGNCIDSLLHTLRATWYTFPAISAAFLLFSLNTDMPLTVRIPTTNITGTIANNRNVTNQE